MKWVLITTVAITLILIISALTVAVFVTTTEKSQHADNHKALDDNSVVRTNNAKTVVIVFSRSGNTHVLANHIASLHNADV